MPEKRLLMQVRDIEANNRIASIPGMTPRKWRIVRIFEAFIRLLSQLLPQACRKKSPTGPPASVLVAEYWNLGDLAIILPFLSNLRESFPRTRIVLLANPRVGSLLEGRRIADEVIPVRVPWARHFTRWRKYNPFSPDWFSLIRTILTLRKRGFDWAFSGRMDTRDNLILWLSGARRRIGYAVGGGGSFLTDIVLPDMSRPHRADVWLHLLNAVGVLPDSRKGALQLSNTDIADARSLLIARAIPPNAFLLGVHPGARVALRRWGNKRFAEVAARMLAKKEVHILWFGEPDDRSAVPALDRCHSVRLNLRHFLAVLSACQLLLCNDSGPMHLANLLNVPVVAVFGPQRPEWFGPRGAKDRVVIRPEFSCRPCSDYCIFDQPYCLRVISTEEVYRAVESTFQQLSGARHLLRERDA